MTRTHIRRVVGAFAALSLVATACGGSDDDGGGAASEPAATEASADEPAPVATEAAEIVVEAEEQPVSTDAEPDEGDVAESDTSEPATTEAPSVEEAVAAPAGELRVASFGPVTSYNPAAVNSAQFGYLIPVYDTLTRQNADLQVVPGLATAWTRPEPNIWEFTVRDDVVFHDGAAFGAQVAVDNIDYHATFEGNPNAGTWATFVEARVVDDVTFQVEFAQPVPQFPLSMSLIQGMMISPNALDGADLTRSPQGSGPWVHSDADSQAGVTEVFALNENYWNPRRPGRRAHLDHELPRQQCPPQRVGHGRSRRVHHDRRCPDRRRTRRRRGTRGGSELLPPHPDHRPRWRAQSGVGRRTSAPGDRPVGRPRCVQRRDPRRSIGHERRHLPVQLLAVLLGQTSTTRTATTPSGRASCWPRRATPTASRSRCRSCPPSRRRSS